MLEQALTELFGQQAAEDPPPDRAEIAAAVRGGRRLRRRRMIAAAGTPLLAGIAVLAVGLATALPHSAPTRSASPGRAAPSTAPSPAPSTAPSTGHALAPVLFNPLVPDVVFGWLPIRGARISVLDSRTAIFIDVAGPESTTTWQLQLFARGACSLRQSRLACRDLQPGADPSTTGSAPAVDGFAAYWSFPYTLIFHYADGGWATLSLPATAGLRNNAAAAEALRIARSLQFGRGAERILFPAQVTGLPAGWAVRSVQFSDVWPSPRGQRLLASSYQIAPGPLLSEPWTDSSDIPNLTIEPADQQAAGCPNTLQPRTVTINGFAVSVLQSAAEQDLCTNDADGLAVSIDVSGQDPPISVTQLFSRLRLLGPDPARWAASPLG